MRCRHSCNSKYRAPDVSPVSASTAWAWRPGRGWAWPRSPSLQASCTRAKRGRTMSAAPSATGVPGVPGLGAAAPVAVVPGWHSALSRAIVLLMWCSTRSASDNKAVRDCRPRCLSLRPVPPRSSATPYLAPAREPSRRRGTQANAAGRSRQPASHRTGPGCGPPRARKNNRPTSRASSSTCVLLRRDERLRAPHLSPLDPSKQTPKAHCAASTRSTFRIPRAARSSKSPIPRRARPPPGPQSCSAPTRETEGSNKSNRSSSSEGSDGSIGRRRGTMATPAKTEPTPGPAPRPKGARQSSSCAECRR